MQTRANEKKKKTPQSVEVTAAKQQHPHTRTKEIHFFRLLLFFFFLLFSVVSRLSSNTLRERPRSRGADTTELNSEPWKSERDKRQQTPVKEEAAYHLPPQSEITVEKSKLLGPTSSDDARVFTQYPTNLFEDADTCWYLCHLLKVNISTLFAFIFLEMSRI